MVAPYVMEIHYAVNPYRWTWYVSQWSHDRRGSSILLRWLNYLPGNYWASPWDAAADLVTPQQLHCSANFWGRPLCSLCWVEGFPDSSLILV